MAAEKEGSRARHKRSAGPAKRKRAGRPAEEDAKLGRGAAVIDVNPWSAFFETFWEPAEGEIADDGRGGAPISGNDTRTPDMRVRKGSRRGTVKLHGEEPNA